MKRFAKTGSLLRFLFRRDRIRLPVWILSIAAFTAGFVPLFDGFLLEDADPQVFATMMENPAMIALAGPVYGKADYHTGAAYANMMLVFCVLFAALMNLFLVARHTRAEEEAGRADLLRAQPVGRAANLTSVLLGALVANLLLAGVTALFLSAFPAQGMTTEGALLFGAALGAVGWFFAGLTLVLTQITENTRVVTTGALLLLLLFYLQRAAGDLVSETLALWSPLGLILRTRLYVTNEWWPVAILFGAGLLLAAFAFAIARRRDLGAGLFPARSGRNNGSPLLSSPFGLALRLLRNSLLIWGITVFVVAAMYGSVFGEMEHFINSNAMFREMFASDPDLSVLEQFIGLLNALMAMLTTIPVMGMVQRMAVEEESGRIEPVVGRGVSRTKFFVSWLLPAFGYTIVLQTLVAVGFYSVGSMVTEQVPYLTTFLISAYSYLPAIWLMSAMGAFLAAAFPKKRHLAYLYLAISFVLVYIGSVANFPNWVQKVTPFDYVSNYPVEILKLLPLLIMNGVSLLLVMAAILLYRRRDLQIG